MTNKERVLALLRSKNCWVASYDLYKVSTRWGWIGSSGDRRARELRADGILESTFAKNIKGSKVADNIVCFRIKKKEGQHYGERAIAG